jgi:tetratricopeptide (TPR) repeat protein
MNFFKSRVFSGGNYYAALLYVGFVLFLGVYAARQGLSYYYSDEAFRTGSNIDAESAIYYQPENPDAHKVHGMLFLRNKDYDSAAEAFEKAIDLRKNDFLLWLRLGYSRFKSGDINAARTAYQKGLSLAPRYSQPNYYMGMMLLENGQYERAFPFLSKAAAYDPELYPEILHLARITFPDNPQAIERSVQPESAKARKIVARYLIKHDFMTDNLKSLLVADELSESEKNEFIGSLIEKHNFEVAREVWLSKQKNENASSNELMFDGGFEQIAESDPNGFGWQIDQKASAISVAIDSSQFHAGSRAVLIKFAGNVELGRKLVSQLVYLQPNRKYQLRFFYRSAELISAGLPSLVITDGISNETFSRSAAFESTDGKWVLAKVDFVTKEAPVAFISLQRSSCNTSPCPIFGELSFDDFSISENSDLPVTP